MRRHEVDIIICGGGMAGLAAAYSLRNADVRVALLEARTLAGPTGSSFGKSRMYRRMYSDFRQSHLAERSLELWRSIQKTHGVRLLHECGLLFFGEDWNQETIEGSLGGAKEVMKQRGIPFEELDSERINTRWALHSHPEFGGLFEPSGGTLFADVALSTLAKAARECGIDIRLGVPVQKLDEGRDRSWEVLTDHGECWRAQTLILTAGPWTNELLSSLDWRLPLSLWSMPWGHYRVAAHVAERLPQWYCFQRPREETQDGGLYYGFPSLQEGCIKVGVDWCPKELRSDSMEAFATQPDEVRANLLDEFLRRHIDGIEERMDLVCSPYTVTPDTHFILDRSKQHPSLIVFAGGSGRAFKFAPLIGECLADLAMSRPLKDDISCWSLDRDGLHE